MALFILLFWTRQAVRSLRNTKIPVPWQREAEGQHFTGVIWYLPTMKHSWEKRDSRAPLCQQKCPTPAGKQIMLLPALASLPLSPSCFLPEQGEGWAPSVLQLPPVGGGNGSTGREGRRQRGLNPSSLSWTVGSTHGGRRRGQVPCPRLHSARRKHGWFVSDSFRTVSSQPVPLLFPHGSWGWFQH